MHSKAVETTVGFFVALGLGALLILAMKVSNLNLASVNAGDPYAVTARFTNIGGLKVRSPVKMAGVRIGRVAAIDLDEDTFEAVATLAINPAFDAIPSDSSASIYTAGLLGEQYVGIDAGGDIEFLQNGDELILTTSAVVLEQVIGQFLYDKASGD